MDQITKLIKNSKAHAVYLQRIATSKFRHRFRAGLHHMQTVQLHRAARNKGTKSGAPEKLRGRQKWQRGDKIYDFRDHGVRRRTFSRLNLIKTYLFSTMAQDRLSGLAIIAEEKEVGTQSICHIVV